MHRLGIKTNQETTPRTHRRTPKPVCMSCTERRSGGSDRLGLWWIVGAGRVTVFSHSFLSICVYVYRWRVSCSCGLGVAELMNHLHMCMENAFQVYLFIFNISFSLSLFFLLFVFFLTFSCTPVLISGLFVLSLKTSRLVCQLTGINECWARWLPSLHETWAMMSLSASRVVWQGPGRAIKR